MTTTRKYRLVCPIARALDSIGDRWALLVLRDLHAGPARFGELLAGLTGIASNLLASRLDELATDGLIRKVEGPHQVIVYELTPLGEHTANLLYELAAFGSRLPITSDVKPPGNPRTLAITLKVACTRVVDPTLVLDLELRVAGQPLTLQAKKGKVDVRVGPSAAPQVVIETDYASMIAVTDGEISVPDFAARITVTARAPEAVKPALGLLAAAIARIAADSPEGALTPPRQPKKHAERGQRSTARTRKQTAR